MKFTVSILIFCLVLLSGCRLISNNQAGQQPAVNSNTVMPEEAGEAEDITANHLDQAIDAINVLEELGLE
jgi:hypothetical protein